MKKKELFGRIAFGLAAIILPLTMVGCGNRHLALSAEPSYYETNNIKGYAGDSYDAAPAYDSYAEEGYYDDYYVEDVVSEGDMGVGGDTLTESDVASATEAKRKLIRTVDLKVETTSFEATISGVQSELSRLGGYIENEYTYNGSAYSTYSNARYATITVRIPDDKLDEFVGSVSGVANVISKSTTTEDVTLKYVDVEGKKEMYLAEEQSLLMLLEKAETVEDISYLVSRLSEVRYNIESMESTLRTYDNLVDYATVVLSVDEVEILTPVEVEEKSIGDQIKEGFDASMKDVLYSLRRTGMNLLIDSPYIIRFFVTLGIIVGAIFLAIKIVIAIIKASIKKAKKKKELKNKNKEVLATPVEETITEEVVEKEVEAEKVEE